MTSTANTLAFATRVPGAMFLRDLHYRNSSLSIKDLDADDAVIRKRQLLCEFRKSLRGDVDILIVPRGRAERSTAIQVKRYKIEVESDEADHSVQIKRMARLFEEGVGAVLIDTRIRNAGRDTHDGADSLLRSQISNPISTAKLRPRVGLIQDDFVQAMDRPPFALGSSGLHWHGIATQSEQDADLTQWLATLRKTTPSQPSWKAKSSLMET